MGKEGVSFKFKKKLCDDVQKIAKKKFPLHVGESEVYSVAIKAVLIDFVTRNKRLLNESKSKQLTPNSQEKPIETT